MHIEELHLFSFLKIVKDRNVCIQKEINHAKFLKITTFYFFSGLTHLEIPKKEVERRERGEGRVRIMKILIFFSS